MGIAPKTAGAHEAPSNAGRRDFLKAGLGALAGASLWGSLRRAAAEEAADAGPGRRPNIIFVLADDYGLDGVGCYGSDRYKTPNIDALAQDGLRFETCYSAPLCGPTRCEFTTGRYPFRTGGLDNGSAGQPSPQKEIGIAKVLAAAGYATCHVGKWRQMCATPADWGFGEYLTDPTAGGWYWQKSYTANGKAIQTDKEIYYPDVMHEYAMDFMARHKDKPFFLYYATHLVHAPILRTPDSKPDGGNFYADNITYMDKLVGKLMADLERLKLRENTLVLFSGDNGTAGHSGTSGGRAINGAKGSMLEGGARVPLIANWKGTTPAGKVCKDMVDFTDLFPTFAELAGAKLPEGVVLDGHSFAPQLHGQPGHPREWIFVQLGGRWYAREPRWKLNNAGELFDMQDAPFVEKLVPAEGESAEAAAGRKRLQAVFDSLKPTGEGAGGGGGGRRGAARKKGR